jgi:hypothetical protein
VRTKRLSQLLRLNRTAFLNIVQANVGDGTIIVNNLLQVCELNITWRQFYTYVEHESSYTWSSSYP